MLTELRVKRAAAAARARPVHRRRRVHGHPAAPAVEAPSGYEAPARRERRHRPLRRRACGAGSALGAGSAAARARRRLARGVRRATQNSTGSRSIRGRNTRPAPMASTAAATVVATPRPAPIASVRPSWAFTVAAMRGGLPAGWFAAIQKLSRFAAGRRRDGPPGHRRGGRDSRPPAAAGLGRRRRLRHARAPYRRACDGWRARRPEVPSSARHPPHATNRQAASRRSHRQRRVRRPSGMA